MDESPNFGPTVDFPSTVSEQLRRDFETAWLSALNGAPRLEDFLAKAPDTELLSIREEMERIDSHFRQLLSSRFYSAPTAYFPPPSAVATPPAGTVEGAIPPPPDNVYPATPLGGGTVDEASGKVIPMVLPKSHQGGKVYPVVPGYVILGELGRGGMGVVYKARHEKLNRVVALKMILAGDHAGSALLARFYIEAQAVAKLQHVNIVQIFEISEYGGRPFFSLEYVDGGSLSKKIGRSPQPPLEAAATVETLARGIEVAHGNGIIHRDLKPANVLLTKDGVPKVTDFGLARKLEDDSGQTRAGSILGTPAYMAPEQARGEIDKVGPLADTYALGAILYEMLTGRPPFQGANMYDTLEQVRGQEPVAPSQLAPKTPKDLETICLKCLRKDAAKRYQSAEELADDLRRFLEGRPIEARPVPRWERLWSWCKRNPVVASLSGAAAGLLILFVGYLTYSNWQLNQKNEEIGRAWHEEEQRRREAEAARKTAEAARKKEEEAKAVAVAAEGKEKKARTEADNDVDASLNVLRGFVLDGIQNTMKDRLDLLPLRKQMTQLTLLHMQKLSDSLKARTIKERSTMAANVRLGDIYMQMGEPTRAKGHYELSLAILEQAAKEQPDSQAAMHNVAGVKNKLGDVALLLQDVRTARALYEDSLRLRQEMLRRREEEASGKRPVPAGEARPPANAFQVADMRLAIARSYGLLGRASDVAGDPRAAADSYRLSEETYEELPAQYAARLPSIEQATVEMERANLKQKLGRNQLRLGRMAEGQRNLHDAVRRWSAVLNRAPGEASLLRSVAFARCELGDLALIWNGDLFGGVEHYKAAVASLEEAHRQRPQDPASSVDLAFGYYRLATACRQLALTQRGLAAVPWGVTATTYYERGRGLLEKVYALDRDNSDVASQLMLVNARLGRRPEAIGMAEALIKKVPNDPRRLFLAASSYAICGEQLDKAVELLRLAVQHGYRDVTALERDPDLEALRGHPKLEALIAQLRLKAGK